MTSQILRIPESAGARATGEPSPCGRRVASRHVGLKHAIGNTTFRSERGLWITEMPDYTILTDADFTDCTPHATQSLKRSIDSRWLYTIHVSPSAQVDALNRRVLHSRIVGGQILAYKYLECSIAGNACVYYGYIPTTEQPSMPDTHQRCRFSMQAVFPRKLYVFMERDRVCTCLDHARTTAPSVADNDEACFKWTSLSIEANQRKITFCGRNIPWSRIYVMMGDFDEGFVEILKPPRECHVCAQCFECSRGAAYCRRHTVCRHKQARVTRNDASVVAAITSESNATTSGARMRRCKRVRDAA